MNQLPTPLHPKRNRTTSLPGQGQLTFHQRQISTDRVVGSEYLLVSAEVHMYQMISTLRTPGMSTKHTH